MTSIRDFIQQDGFAVTTVRGRLEAFSPELLTAFDNVVTLFEQMGEEFSSGSSDDEDLLVINDSAANLGLNDENEIASILSAPVPSDPELAESTERILDARNRITSRRVRGVLMGLLWRSFLRAATDFFRFRGSTALGHLRFQIEAIGLASIMAQNPSVAARWMETGVNQDGRRFFRQYQPDIMAFAGRHSLNIEYEQGSTAAQHVRLASVAGGFDQRVIARGDVRVQETEVLYLEDTPDEPWQLVLQGLNVLRAQAKIFLAIREGFPEITTAGIERSGLNELHRVIQRLFRRFEETFPEKVAEWREMQGR